MKCAALALVALIVAEPLAANAQTSRAISFVETIVADGRERTVRLYVPAEREVRPALVISFHGRGGTGRDQERTSGLSNVADEAGFLVAYPDGIERSWNDGRGLSSYGAQREGVDDVGFVIALIDHLVASRDVDPARVYLTGLSNGGLMAMRVACEHSDRIAGIGIVGRTLTRDLANQCARSTAVPAMFVMGTADPLVPFEGGQQRMGAFQRVAVLGAEETAATWARGNGVTAGQPRRSTIEDEVREDGVQGGFRLDYGSQTSHARVALVALAGGGHTWPRGYMALSPRLVGRTSLDFHAAREIWAFFSRSGRTD